jgi:hypothetical protein
MIKIKLLGTAAALVMVPGLALAGPCTTQISEFERSLNLAGTAPPMGSGSNASGAPAAQPGGPGGQVATEGAPSRPAIGSGSIASGAPAAQPGGPEADTTTTTGSITIPPSGRQPGMVAASPQAMAALSQARQFDRAGNAIGCMDSLSEARRLMGAR